MLEIPESTVIAKQVTETLKGKCISYVEANQSPHKFAWYEGDPNSYDDLLSGKCITGATARGGMLEIEIEDCVLVLQDGANPRYLINLKDVPKKHQLLVEFDDETALVVTIAMYGGMLAFKKGNTENEYYIGAVEKVSPMSDAFDYQYFQSLRDEKSGRLSAKAFLATKQRIPGLGNGVLQDILYEAKIFPKRRMETISEEEYKVLFDAVKNVLKEMTDGGGRDTEKDLFGHKGGYISYLSKNTLHTPCLRCGYEIHKEAYMGGTIYYCEHCQK
ncbi:MAG TPA: DNA-formamidopyrimidine glycosylase family protein [Lachnospiraceae bacterium]|nr:DNA-formamidopyrimidine glycosylase family protein [Lachnospiraceae bacterium]